VKEGAFENAYPELASKLQSISLQEARMRRNRSRYFALLVLTAIPCFYLVTVSAPYGGIVLFYIWMFGMYYVWYRLLRTSSYLTTEDKVLKHAAEALRALFHYDSRQDPVLLKRCKDELKEAAKVIRKDPSLSFQIYKEFQSDKRELRRALSDTFPPKVTDSERSQVTDFLTRLVPVLMSPSLESVDKLARDLGKVEPPPKVPPARFDWAYFIDARPGKLWLALVIAFVVPLPVVSGLAALIGLDPLAFLRTNLAVIVFGMLGMFAVLFTWAMQKPAAGAP
jgi:hypothetical protein